MKKLALTTICVVALSTGAFAQGLVNFLNNATTLVTLSSNSTSLGSTPAVAGQYIYGLFVAPQGTSDLNAFQFTGVLGTNQASAGRFSGGAGRAVAGWPAGGTRAVLVRGWSASWGTDWNAVLANLGGNAIDPTSALALEGFYGYSVIAPNLGPAGGFDGTGTLPNLNIVGGATGIGAGGSMN